MSKGVGSYFNKRAKNYEEYSLWCKDPELFRLCTEPLQDMIPRILCLDLGGGSGWIAKRDNAESDRKWVVLDISPKMAQHVRTHVNFILGDAQKCPLRDQAFGHIVARSLLQYVDASKVLKEANRLLLPRGHLVIAQKIASFRPEDLEWHIELLKLRSPLVINRWTDRDLESLVINHGFNILRHYKHYERRTLPFEMWINKNGTISKKNQEKIMNMLRNAPRSVQKDLELIVTDNEIAYNRTWSILISRIQPAKSSLTPTVFSFIIERNIGGQVNILLQKRRKRYEEPDFYGYWELPQGKLEKNDSVIETIRREIRQETGLELASQSGVSESIHIDPKNWVESVRPLICVRTQGQTDFSAMAIVVSAKGEPRATDIRRDHTWVQINELPDMLNSQPFFPVNKPMIEEYLRCLRKRRIVNGI